MFVVACRFDTDSTAGELWVQLLGALGVVPSGGMPLVTRNLHRAIHEVVSRHCYDNPHSAAQPPQRLRSSLACRFHVSNLPKHKPTPGGCVAGGWPQVGKAHALALQVGCT